MIWLVVWIVLVLDVLEYVRQKGHALFGQNTDLSDEGC